MHARAEDCLRTASGLPSPKCVARDPDPPACSETPSSNAWRSLHLSPTSFSILLLDSDPIAGGCAVREDTRHRAQISRLFRPAPAPSPSLAAKPSWNRALAAPD